MSEAAQFYLGLCLVAGLVGLLSGGLMGLGVACAKRLCPACGEFIRRTAKKCPQCHEWLPLLAGLLLAVPSISLAQVVLLDCPAVAFFGPACVVIETTMGVPPATPPEAYPLFDRQTLAPDTPELMLHLLAHPTEANAQAFLAWQAARQARITEVQHLLRTAPRPTR